MNQRLARAALLYDHARYADAERELRGLLAETPRDAQAHALLALCLARQEKLDDAQAEVEQSIALEPAWAHGHYCRAAVLLERRRYPEAEQSAREAVRLDPGDADNYAQLAATLFAQDRWQDSLTAALEGLAHNAEHAGCESYRTMALTKLGRQREAIRSVDESLARNPESAMGHANKGWALLHEGQPRPALVHFREALRLDPTFDYARAGMVEALKAHNPMYRWMLAYFLWMSRLSPRARWGVVLGGYFGSRLLGAAAESNPALEPWIRPILLVYLAFVLLTWFSMPLFNLLLRVSRFGRHALSRDQRVASNWFAACLALFTIGAVAAVVTDLDPLFAVAVFGLGMALPLTMTYHCEPGWPRRMMGWYCVAMAAAGLVVLTGLTLEMTTDAATSRWAKPFITVFILGVIGSPWMANYLVSVTVRR